MGRDGRIDDRVEDLGETRRNQETRGSAQRSRRTGVLDRGRAPGFFLTQTGSSVEQQTKSPKLDGWLEPILAARGVWGINGQEAGLWKEGQWRRGLGNGNSLGDGR